MLLFVSGHLVIRDKPADPVPTPINLIKYLEDPDYEHEDFTLSSAATLRARVCELVLCQTSLAGINSISRTTRVVTIIFIFKLIIDP